MFHSTDVPLRIDALRKRLRGKSALVEQVLAEFEEEARRDLQSLAKSLEDKDADRTASVAHALKGAAGLVSADVLHGFVAELEQRARLNGLTGADECFARVKKEVEECLAYISIARRADLGTEIRKAVDGGQHAHPDR